MYLYEILFSIFWWFFSTLILCMNVLFSERCIVEINLLTYYSPNFLTCCHQQTTNGVARIFVWGGGTRPISPGTFPEADTFSGGGGGSRVVGEIFPITPGKQQSDYLNGGTFFYISDSNNVTTSIHRTKKTFTKNVGGGMAPPGYATANNIPHNM